MAAGTRSRVDVAPGLLPDAIASLSRQMGLSIGYDHALPPLKTTGLRGRFVPAAALRRLLRGSGLTVTRLNSTVFRIEREREEPPSPPQALPAEEIVVLGTKRHETLANVPFAMSIVSLRGMPFRSQPATTEDIVGAAGDVQLTNLGPGRNRLFIRGIADSVFAGPTQSTVSIYLDDARINFNTPDPDLRLVDVDRVEVLKGPQGSLYGTGALAGIYRIVPARPVLDELSGNAGIGLSSVAHGGLGASAQGVFNLPVTEQAAVRLAGYAISDGGWIDDTGRDRSNVNRVETIGARGSALVRLRPDWTVEAAGAAQFISARDSQYAVRGDGRLARSTALAEPSDNDFLHARLAITGRAGNLDLMSTTAGIRHDVKNSYDASAAAALFGRAGPLGFDERQTLTLFTHETRVTDPSLERPWVAGVSLLSGASKLSGTLTAGTRPREEVFLLNHVVREAALFGEATLPLSASLDATLGARLSVTKSDDERSSGDAEVDATKLALSPMAALHWRPRDGVQLYARYADALRPGGLNPTGAPPRFASDHLESLEAGGRLSTADERLQLTFDLFRVHWRDIQSDMLRANGLVATANVGTARSSGGEISLTLRPAAGWRVELGGVLQESVLQASATATESGLPSIPEASARAGLSRDMAFAGGHLSMDIHARYIGRSRLSFDPTLSRRMGGYGTIDGGVVYSGGVWRIGLDVTNLFDGDGDTFSFGNPFSARLVDQREPLRPRSLAFKIERRF